MRKTKEQKTNKGITLIALVITIIVMMILVAVTITMAVNGGLFDYAGKASSETKNAIKDEQWLADGGVQIGDVYYTIDEYLSQVTENNGSRLKLSYTVTPAEDNLSAIITVNAKMLGGPIKGFEDYRTWALKKLEGKTEEEIEQIFVNGYNFMNELHSTGAPRFANIQELIEYMLAEYDGEGSYDDVDSMVEWYGYPSLAEFAISKGIVYPEQYEFWGYINFSIWARRQLHGKTDEEIGQIFIDGYNYLNEINNSRLPEIYTIEDFVVVCREQFPEFYGECEDIYDIMEVNGFYSFADMAIEYGFVYPEKFDEFEGVREAYESENGLYIMLPTGWKRYDINTVEYEVYGNGEYTFKAANIAGTESNSITVKIDTLGCLAGKDGERFSYIYEKTETYIDKNNDTAVIPKGFSVGMSDDINTVKNGLVIRDEKGNEFVWVPVTKTLDNSYSYAKGYLEPAAVDDDAGRGYNFTNEYNAMVTSVNNNNGFYIGRCETTKHESGSNLYSGSVIGSPVMISDDWYYLYEAQKRANIEGNGTNVQTSMIYGVLWDETMAFITQYDSNYDVNAYPTGADTISQKSSNISYAGGYFDEYGNLHNGGDVTLNIFGLASNRAEWTQESCGGELRVIRGAMEVKGKTEGYSSSRNADYGTSYYNDAESNYFGSRMIMYIL